jgi:hypothetical protein
LLIVTASRSGDLKSPSKSHFFGVVVGVASGKANVEVGAAAGVAGVPVGDADGVGLGLGVGVGLGSGGIMFSQ